LDVAVPPELPITQVGTALTCPCRFLLAFLLKIRELPEFQAGLPPRDRGDRLHKILQRFTQTFGDILDRLGAWEDNGARDLLKAAARDFLDPFQGDLHWQAELHRLLGQEQDSGLLGQWLAREKERFEAQWRWLAAESTFAGLASEDWDFSLRGRIDRIDYHPEEGLVLWDYKSGEVPSAKLVFEEKQEFQLPVYLLAVKEGLVGAPGVTDPLRAGFIGLKSTRQGHLQYQDFGKRAVEWPQVIESWKARLDAFSRRLRTGDLRPAPEPPPQGPQDLGSCKYCPYSLVCTFALEPETDEEDEP
jgi:ATP-dependent helicase/DNAse subunit B